MSETMRTDGPGLQPVKPPSNPAYAPQNIVQTHRTGGALDANALADTMVRMSGGDPAKLQALADAFGPSLTPLEKGKVEQAVQYADMGVLDHVGDGIAQVGRGLWGMAKGLGQMAWGAGKIAYDSNPIGQANDLFERATGVDLPDALPSAARGEQRVQGVVDTTVALGKAVWNDPSILIQEYKDLGAQGRYGAIVGQLVVDLGDVVIGAKGAGKAGKVAGVAGDLNRIADAGALARVADGAADLARASRAAPDEAASALQKTRAALAEVDLSTVPDETAVRVRGAIDEIDQTLGTQRRRPIGGAGDSAYGGRDVGAVSGRPYDLAEAGGAIRKLDWRGATIDAGGIDAVKLHTSRFGQSDGNAIMIERLEKIAAGEMRPTDTDLRFYTHEMRELERYRAIGVPDGVNPPADSPVWNNAHTATLEDFGLTDKAPDGGSNFYTPEAVAADEAQMMRELDL